MFKGTESMLLRSVANVQKGTSVGEYDRYNMQRQVSLTANIAGEDLGRAAKRISQAIAKAGAPPPRVAVNVRGQIIPMQQMLAGLRTGLLLAVVVIFLLLAANFQSVKLSFVVVSTVPPSSRCCSCALAYAHHSERPVVYGRKSWRSAWPWRTRFFWSHLLNVIA